MHISGGFSKAYNKQGVTNFYQKQGHAYSNPHGYDIARLIRKKLNKNNPYIRSQSKILDLACGSGQVTVPLLGLGYKYIKGTDPYTFDAYEKNTKSKCDRFGFMDILQDCYIKQQQQQLSKQQKPTLTDNNNSNSNNNNSNSNTNSNSDSNSKWVFDCIICSYAMHLVKQSMLHDFCNKLAQLSKYLIIISPHKLPVMKDNYGWQELQSCASDKIHFRAYRSYNYDQQQDNVNNVKAVQQKEQVENNAENQEKLQTINKQNRKVQQCNQ